MNGNFQMSHSQGSKDGSKKRSSTKKYFTVSDDFQILEAFKAKGGMVHTNEIVQDLALTINREPSSISQRHKKLNGLCEDDKKQIVDYFKNKVADPLKSYVFFEKPPSKKIECIKDQHPSVFFAEKTLKSERIVEEQDPEELVNQYYDNQVYEQVDQEETNEIRESMQYRNSISKPLAEKLKDCVPISSPEKAFGTILPPGGGIYESLGKRELNSGETGEGEEPSKKLVSDSTPFGVLNENTLDDRRVLPKHDKEKNIVLTPNTKEEIESHKQFLNETFESLAQTHNMEVSQVLKFALDLKLEILSFDKIHQALLKVAENKDQTKLSQPKQTKKLSTQMPNPIR